MPDHTIELITPKPPNFVKLDVGTTSPNDAPTLLISALTEGQKDSLAAEWRKSLDVVAERQRSTA